MKRSSLIFAILTMLSSSSITHSARSRLRLTISSSSFTNGGIINSKYTCDGQDISPELQWKLKPKNNVGTYVLIVDDPDAQKVVGKTFVHWIVLLPPYITQLPGGISTRKGSSLKLLDPAAREEQNDFGTRTYGGPCPPEASGEHTYRFTLFAVTEPIDTVINTLQAPFTADTFKRIMRNKIIAQTRITGRYTRVPQA